MRNRARPVIHPIQSLRPVFECSCVCARGAAPTAQQSSLCAHSCTIQAHTRGDVFPTHHMYTTNYDEYAGADQRGRSVANCAAERDAAVFAMRFYKNGGDHPSQRHLEASHEQRNHCTLSGGNISSLLPRCNGIRICMHGEARRECIADRFGHQLGVRCGWGRLCRYQRSCWQGWSVLGQVKATRSAGHRTVRKLCL